MKKMLEQKIAKIYAEVMNLAYTHTADTTIMDKIHDAYLAMLLETDGMPNMQKMINNYEKLTISHVCHIMKIAK